MPYMAERAWGIDSFLLCMTTWSGRVIDGAANAALVMLTTYSLWEATYGLRLALLQII